MKLYRQALDSEFPSTAARHHTMLVHESVKQVEHAALADKIREAWRAVRLQHSPRFIPPTRPLSRRFPARVPCARRRIPLP